MAASPLNLLLLFFASQLLIYFDRGLISAVLPALSRSFLVSDSEMGLIGSCFIFGYMLACPLFAFFSRTFSVYKLMAIGLFLWTVAVLLCGLTNNFITLLGARILTGVGEASFAGLAPACIDDVSPKKWRTLWLSFFYAGLPIGGAIGYVVGGELVNGRVAFPGLGLDWHSGFLLEAGLMVPVIVTVFLWPDAPVSVDSPASPLSPPSPALLRRASTQLARYGSLPALSSAHGYVSHRRVSAPPQLNAFDYPVARFSHTAPRSLSSAFDTQGPFAGSTPTSDRTAEEGRRAFEAASAAAHLPMSSSAPNAPAVLTDEGRSHSSSSSLSLSSPSPSPSPPSAQVVYVPSTPPYRASAQSQRSPSLHHLTVSTAHLAPHSHPLTRPYSQSASNLYSLSSTGPFHHNPAYSRTSPLHLSSSHSHSLLPPPSPTPSEHQWYDIQWNDDQVQFGTDISSLFSDSIYICVVLGYSALAFVIGALSFWAPVDFAKMLNLSIEQSTKAIGIITFFCGILGTGFGGWSLDFWKKGTSKKIQAVLASLEICVLYTSISIGFGVLSIVVVRPVPSLALLAASNFFLFATSAPINAALLSVAPPDLRSLAMAMSILIMHLLGDLPSPFLLGIVTELCGDVRLSLLMLLSWLGWTVTLWSFGAVLARKEVEQLKIQAISEGRMGLDTDSRTEEQEGKEEGQRGTADKASGGQVRTPRRAKDERERREQKEEEKQPLLAH